MSYPPRMLYEYNDAELEAELAKRKAERAKTTAVARSYPWRCQTCSTDRTVTDHDGKVGYGPCPNGCSKQ